MTSLLLAFLLCLIISAFLSGAEMAFVSANKIRIRENADSGNAAAGKIVRLQETPHHFLTAMLIGNNIVNIAATVIGTYALEKHFGVHNEWLVTAIVAPVLIIFGETVPKDYCRLKSQSFLLKYAWTLDFFVRLFRFPSEIIQRMIVFFMGPLGAAVDQSIFVSEREFRVLIEESAKSGVLDKHEKKLIDTILDFERIHVESVMTMVDKVPKVEISEHAGKVKEIARRTHSRMVLVYEEIPALIVGMIYVFDLLFDAREEDGLKKYLRSPIFLSKNTSIEKAFLTLQEKRQSFAVVTGATHEVIGVVPLDKLFTL